MADEPRTVEATTIYLVVIRATSRIAATATVHWTLNWCYNGIALH